MSAIDRAFIKAYSDEQSATAEPPPVRSRQSNPPIKATTAAATATAATQAPAARRTTSRTRRSAAAAAIRAEEPTVPAVAIHAHPEAVATVEAAARPAPAIVETKPKMVVGRRALKKLAESAVVPTPHLTFSPAARTATSPTTDKELEAAPVIATPHSPVSVARSVEQRPALGDRAPAQEPDFADAKMPQYRLDPAVAATATARRSSDSGAPQTTTKNAAAMPRSAIAVAPANDLRPLSSYRPPEPTPTPIAALEVDRLAWPPACRMLIERAGNELESAASALAEHADGGCQTIAICSIDEAQGCTSVVLCLAIKLVAQGLRVCLVDGNATHPQLAEIVGLEPDRGLESILAGEATLGEVLIESLEDAVTMLPLCKPLRPDAIERSKLRQTVTFGELRDQFDLVLVDAGCVGAQAARPSILAGGSIDAAIVVGCVREEQIAWQRARQALEQWSVPCLGAIENRC